ncbi:hypothetical protein [Prosthecobacter sp.]|uniref:hypothetical protein n=1 Tax=Prosthecobacter sp. TaxID=1965333 RepID=UPI003784A09D
MSQTLAATVILAVVFIMLSPLRRGPVESPSRQAGWTPLLSLGGMADSAAFHRVHASPSAFATSTEPLCRKPSNLVP